MWRREPAAARGPEGDSDGRLEHLKDEELPPELPDGPGPGPGPDPVLQLLDDLMYPECVGSWDWREDEADQGPDLWDEAAYRSRLALAEEIDRKARAEFDRVMEGLRALRADDVLGLLCHAGRAFYRAGFDAARRPRRDPAPRPAAVSYLQAFWPFLSGEIEGYIDDIRQIDYYDEMDRLRASVTLDAILDPEQKAQFVQRSNQSGKPLREFAEAAVAAYLEADGGLPAPDAPRWAPDRLDAVAERMTRLLDRARQKASDLQLEAGLAWLISNDQYEVLAEAGGRTGAPVEYFVREAILAYLAEPRPRAD